VADFQEGSLSKYWDHYLFVQAYNHPIAITLNQLLLQQCAWPVEIVKFLFIPDLLCIVIATMTVCTELQNMNAPLLHHKVSTHQTEHGGTSGCIWEIMVCIPTHLIHSNSCQIVM